MILKPVPGYELADHWPWIRQGLERIKKKRNAPWEPEDVYTQLRCKTAFLAVVEDAGFIIYQALPGDDFRGVLHVWCIAGELKPYEQQIYADLIELAKGIGVKRIRAIGRKGWARRGFFELAGYVYEREITAADAAGEQHGR